MGICDMCGKSGRLFVVELEGSELNLCKDCSSFGKIIRRPKPIYKKKIAVATPPKKEIIQSIKEDYMDLIRSKRLELGLKQNEFARKLAEKESVIQKIESGAYVPSLNIARKFEKALGIELVEQKEVTPLNIKTKKENLTIGDIIKLK